MKTDSMVNPIGINKKDISFSWKMDSGKRGIKQINYCIIVAEDECFSEIVWNSGNISTDKSVNIEYTGMAFKPSKRYWWKVMVEDNFGGEHKSQPSWFETALMGTGQEVWSNAQWIGDAKNTVNTDAVSQYSISTGVTIEKGGKTGIVIGARNKDNYTLIEFDMSKRKLSVFEYSDNAWTTGIASVNELGTAEISDAAVALGKENEQNHIQIDVNQRSLNVTVNSVVIFSGDDVIPKNPDNQPRKQYMMLIGLKQDTGKAVYDNMTVKNTDTGTVYQQDDFTNSDEVLSVLGTVVAGRLIVENEFNLVNAVPAVNLRKAFNISKKIKSARLYSSAMGFYDAYINGEKVNDDFYNPGFTDYRKRINYQIYDVTDKIIEGQNTVGAIVSKGYYTGYVGYSFYPMTYGEQNYFISKLLIEYSDGTSEVIVTDKSWQFTDKGPVINADYLQGEDYDARLEFDWNDLSDKRWRECGIATWPKEVNPTNGTLTDEYFEFEPQYGPSARTERILKPIGQFTENPVGHFVYDFGQNMVGTIRLKLCGKKGQSVKLRYGEMCYKDGSIYIANLRTAANTDTYTLKGDKRGEVFEPSFTSHGFRYVEITGNGCNLTRADIESLVISIEGLVITNTTDITGEFECSNEDINKLQSNIEWGQRGNSLLVYTDCPQRNERMGWTGDAQVFAATAAYNMDVAAFMKKWLLDVKDGQLLYNKDGAVPDTAPLGGDNRDTGGCAGWGDAAVIVPWEMYRAYGDVTFLEENYDVMKKWVDYQSRDERQNHGLRTVDGVVMTEESDISSQPFIQVQQSRGDHLTFDESTPFILTATAYAAYVAEILANTAEILDNNEDCTKYRRRYEDVKRAFNEAWVQEDGSIAYWGEQSKATKDANGNVINRTYYSNADGSVAKPSQTAYALAIDFGLIPDGKLERVAQCFKESIDDNDGKLSVGFLGISHLAPALTKVGLLDIAFSILEQEENPSWLYSVKNGATTIWERWNSYIAETDTFGDVSMNSFNHYSYGAIGEWMFSDILGINSDNCETGYKKIILKPTFGGSLTYAKGYHDSPYGKIVSEWHLDGDCFIYSCKIPANTDAVLYLPYDNIEGVSGIECDGVSYKGTKDGRCILELACGEYEFKTKIK